MKKESVEDPRKEIALQADSIGCLGGKRGEEIEEGEEADEAEE